MSRILLIGQSYGRGHAATSALFTDLAEHLAAHGHTVDILTSSACGLPSSTSEEGSVCIHRVDGRGPEGPTALWLKLVLWCCTTSRRYEQVILLDTPYLITLAGWILRRRHGTRLISWVMDRPLLQIQRLRPPGSARACLAALLHRLQIELYRRCQVVVTLGCCMQAGLVSEGVSPRRVRVIPTWVDDDIAASALSPQEARRRFALPQAFTVMYSGYAGAWHDFAPILQAVAALAFEDDLQFLFCGLGPGIDSIRSWAEAHSEAHVLFRELVPAHERVASLSCGDVHLVALRASMAGTCCPSKLDALLGLSRPVIAVTPPDTQTARDVVNTGAGICASTAEELIEAIRLMRRSPQFPESWASAARQAFLSSHAASAVLPRWRALIEEPACLLEAR